MNHATDSDYGDRCGMFVMRYKVQSMLAQASTSASVSNNIDCATTHPIRHIGNVPFGNNGHQTYLKNVLHVPTITKNLISVGQIVEQGMQVRFNNEGCFIEKGDRVVAHGR